MDDRDEGTMAGPRCDRWPGMICSDGASRYRPWSKVRIEARR